MFLTQTFLDNLPIPKTAWSNITYNNELCYQLKNEIYCNLFWISMWKNVIPQFLQNQQHVRTIVNLNLTDKVIISKNGYLYYLPNQLATIIYFGNGTINGTFDRPFFFEFPYNGFFIIIFCAILFLVLSLLSSFTPKTFLSLI